MGDMEKGKKKCIEQKTTHEECEPINNKRKTRSFLCHHQKFHNLKALNFIFYSPSLLYIVM